MKMGIERRKIVMLQGTWSEACTCDNLLVPGRESWFPLELPCENV